MTSLKTIRHLILFHVSAVFSLSAQAQDAFTESESNAGTGGDTGVALATANPAEYSSPYVVNFTYSMESLHQDFDTAPRNSAAGESSKPEKDWYDKDSYVIEQTDKVSRLAQVYGPEAAQFPDNDYQSMSPQWQRESVLATALRYQNVQENLPYDGVDKFGISYRHHHIPAFNPVPSYDWPPLEVNGAYPVPADGHGMDCSNFTAWCYNYGLSLKFTSQVGDQGALRSINTYGGASSPQLPIQKFAAKPNETIAELAQRLETGDLLYIENPGAGVVHTVMWVGDLGGVDESKLNAAGRSRYAAQGDTVYLILDSTSDARVDINGNEIPDGPQLREFRDWYFTNFSHANRYIDADPESNTVALLLGGVESSNDWYDSPWLGWFYSTEAAQPWIYHLGLGWLATDFSRTTSIWLYHRELGWLWTNQSVYPSLYGNDQEAWLWWDADASLLWNVSTGTQVAID